MKLRQLLALLPLFLSTSLPAITTAQNFTLQPGWNAIWLNVDPTDSDGEPESVENVFTNPSVSYVATPRLPVGTAEFISEFGDGSFNQSSWRTWHRTSELSSDTLASITGYRSYLVKVDGAAPVTLEITGKARFHQSSWSANSYNLLGFSLTQSVSFDSFFDGFNTTHPSNKIFRLAADGNWVGVLGSDLMKSGEAYWIYSEGNSRFAGPLAIDFDNFDGMNFGPGPAEVEVNDPDGGVGTIFVNLQEITLSNLTDSAQEFRLSIVEPGSAVPATDDLRVYDITPQPGATNFAIGSQITDNNLVETVPAEASRTVTLGAHRNWNSAPRERENLYQMVIGKLSYWLPIRAQNGDLIDAAPNSGAPDVASYQGLWIGDAVVNQVTSVTEAGRPLKNTTSSAPLRFIFHVDSGGAVSLLGHVTLMQEKRASEEVEPTMALVVDDTKIPFFEGIEDRAGTLVGKRFETVSYDMPRKADLTTQDSLLDNVVDLDPTDAITTTTDVTLADLANFINSRTSRPPELAEDYYLTWPASGGFGPNNAINTTLLLDPFHRSNPFRHAFHRGHVAGFPVTRAITIEFDSTQGTGQLTGVYRETLSGAGGVSGLASFDIQTSGTITLSRISEVGALE